MATILDVINTQDSYTNALQLRINARYSYSSALAELRYQTGTLFSPGKTIDDVILADPSTRPDMSFKSLHLDSSADPQSIARAWVVANVPFANAEAVALTEKKAEN